jgi:Domain of unknown function (DUF4345)
MYGGFELGIAAFLIWCAMDPTRVRLGLVASGCMFTGVALGRLFLLATDSGIRPIMQIIAAILSFVALRFAPHSI